MYAKSSSESKGVAMHEDFVPLNTNTDNFSETYFFKQTPRASPNFTLNGVAKGAKAPAPETHSRKKPIDDVMELCCKISKNKQIKATVRNSRKGAAIAGGGAFLGGLLGGPPGIFIGSALGGAVAWWMTSGKFLPLHQIMIEMSPQKKSKLYSEVMAVLDNLNWGDLPQLINLVMKNPSLQTQVCDIVISFFKKELGAKVECG